jgi:hypothetical protein
MIIPACKKCRCDTYYPVSTAHVWRFVAGHSVLAPALALDRYYGRLNMHQDNILKTHFSFPFGMTPQLVCAAVFLVPCCQDSYQ